MDANSSKYENIILLNFNSCMLDSSRKAFCETYKFRSLKISIPAYSKIFEKRLQEQLKVIFDNILSKFIAVFEKGIAHKTAY